MNRFTNFKSIILFALLVAVPFVAGAYSERVSADDGEVHTAQAQVTADENKQNTSGSVVYRYVAQPGDSYSVIARKAVQTYGISKEVKLSHAQIIFAETHLTQAAGSPFLNQGQKVNIKESTVKSWVDKAQKLSDSEKAAWQAYTAGVNFNTNNVGQAR